MVKYLIMSFKCVPMIFTTWENNKCLYTSVKNGFVISLASLGLTNSRKDHDKITLSYFGKRKRAYTKDTSILTFFPNIQWWIQDFPLGGRQPLMHTLFGKNVCKSERNGSCWGGHVPAVPPGSANDIYIMQ